MQPSLRAFLIILIFQLSMRINAQRYLQELFPQVSVTENILYGVNATVINAATSGTADPENLLLDIYEPFGDTATLRPLIIYLHTGNFLPFPENQTPSGTRSDLHVVDLCTRMAKRGYVVASCDYRLGWLPASSDQEIRNNTLINAIYRGMQDARTAARFFRKLVAESANPYRIDSNRIVVAGEGAGAMIALTAATVDGASDFNLPKFIQNGTPIINELINGNADGTSVGINPLNFDTLCYINHPGYNSDFNAAFNLSGALPEISWISSVDPAIFSIHSPTDPFFPYQTDTLNVSVLNYPLFEVSGSGAMQQAINDLGYDDNFLVLNDACDDVSTVASSINNGLAGLYPLNRPADMQNDAFPWEWWSVGNVNSPNGLAVNSNMSAAKSEIFQDTILAFLSPRLMCALNLEGNPCDAGLYGCMDLTACNYCDAAVNDDGSCHYIGDVCDDENDATTGEIWSSDCSCTPPLAGCTHDAACNYNPLALVEDGSCAFAGDACNDNLSSTSSDTYDIDCNCVGVPISPTGCNPADINWATQNYFVSPNPNAGEALADGITGIYYSDNIYLKVPTNIQQVVPTAPSVNITNLTVNNILITPSGSSTAVPLSSIGLSYQCNSNGVTGNCVFLPNQPSCIEIFGVPTATGLYTLTFSINASAGFINVPYQLQIMNLTIVGPGCTNVNACNYDLNASIDNGSCILQGDGCNDGQDYTVNDIINSDCICEGTCPVIIPSASYDPILCFGGETSVAFTYNGGNIPEAIVINGTDTILNNTVSRFAGTFSYYLITEGGCDSPTNSMVVDQPSALLVQLSAENVQCSGYATGNVTAVASGGTLPYSYAWSNGLNTMMITDLSAGVYVVEITDANNCSVSGDITVTEPSSSLSINAFIINPACGNNNGAINIQTSNSVGTVAFNWNDVSGSNQLTNIGAGIYIINVQDDFCAIDTTIILNPSNGPEISSYESQNISCYGENDGFINLEISGGTEPVTVQWSDGITETNRSNLSAGVYVVTLNDALNCSYIQSIEITQPEELVAQISTQNVECFGDNSGSVSFEITGGVQPYAISWNDGIATSQSLYPDLLADEYDYYIEDSLGCALNGMVTIDGPSAPIHVVIEGDPIVCGDLLGSATAVVTGADLVTYQWSNGANTQSITDIPVGDYSVIATSGSCSDTAYFFLGNNLPLVLDTVRSISCYGLNNGYAAAIVSGGTLPYTYEWSAFPGTPSITNPNAEVQDALPPGNYFVSVTESSADACVNGFSFSINEPLPINITATITQISCYGYADGSIAIENIEGGTGVYDVIWSNGSLDTAIQNLAVGTYAVTAIDENGCTSLLNLNLTEPTAMSASAAIADVTCYGNEDGSVMINTSGGTGPYSIIWSNDNLPAEFVVSNLPAGEYAYTITDASGCELMGAETIGGPDSQLTVEISGTPIVCGDEFGVIQANVSGNTAIVHYAWTKDDVGALADTLPLIDSVTVGLYTVVVTSDGCTASDQFFLGNNLPLLTPFSENVSCFGGNNGNASVMPNGGELPYSYLWYSLNGSPLISTPTDSLQYNLFAGTYVVTVSEGSGCISSYEFTIDQPQPLQINAAIENADCSNEFAGSIEIEITGGVAPYVILWEDGTSSTVLSDVPADNYDVYITDSNECSLQQTLNVDQTAVPIEVNFDAIPPNCGDADGSIAFEVLSSNGSVTYLWNGLPGEALSSNLSAGTYFVEYTDGQCYGSDEIILATIGGPQIDSAWITPVSCYGGNDGEIQLYWTAPANSVSFLWSNATTSQNLINENAGEYTVVLTDENLCTYTANYMLSEPEPLIVSYTTQNNNCSGSAEGQVNFDVSGGVAPYSLIWLGITYTENLSFDSLSAGNYSYDVSDVNACMNAGSIEILEPLAIQIAFQTQSITCNNSLGSASAEVTGGTAPYSFNWSSGDNINQADSLIEGTYYLQVQDSFGCSMNDSVFIDNLSAILDIVATVANPSCSGESNGNILINEVVGGYSPFTYEWTNNVGQGNFAGNLTAGEYAITITDSTGCQYYNLFTLIDPAPLAGTISGLDAVNAGDTVTYQFSLSGGTYEWSSSSGMVIGSSNTSEFSVLWLDSVSDVIQLTYTDGNGCEIISSLDVSILVLDILESLMSGLHAYPVPAYDELFIDCDSRMIGNNWSIADHTGRTCMTGTMLGLSQIDVSSLPSGTYFFSCLDASIRIQIMR